MLDLEQHLDRKPANLSGGQRQRVAMGRAIVRDPSAFLMDEPLSNLDAKLRVQMRTEVSRLQADLGTTTVYVTHDQTEAMTLGDRVAVMRAGVLQQVGSPAELYADPTNLFVAGFIGSPAMNFMAGQPHRRAGPAAVRRDRAAGRAALEGRHARRQCRRGIRPGVVRGRLAGGRREITRVHLPGEDRPRRVDGLRAIRVLQARAARSVESDELRELAEDAGTTEVPHAGEGTVVARLDAASQARRGEELELWVDSTKLHLFDPETGQSLKQRSLGRAGRRASCG